MLRMAIGRLGMWLIKIGRILQVRYANWNSEFRLEHEFFPNQDFCTFHVSDRVTDEIYLTFNSLDAQPSKQTPLVKDLLGLKGVAEVGLSPYQIRIEKARVYAWDELLSEIDRIILQHLIAAPDPNQE
jgi:hypothetical protein